MAALEAAARRSSASPARRRSSAAMDPVLANYGFGRELGQGAFANVLLARRRSDGVDVAVKVMLKSHIEREGKTRQVLAESKALQRCRESPHVVDLARTFQDADYLFFDLEFCAGGDLLRVIRGKGGGLARAEGGLPAAHAAFYGAEVVLGLEFLSGLNLAHRDLKPENVLVDARGRCKLADFGTVLDCEAKDADHDLGERHGSFEGTAEYVSPEVLQGERTTPACDLWALGCLVYQLSCGRLPFRAATDFLLWEKIVAFAGGDDSAFETDAAAPEAALDLTKRLMVGDASKRLGVVGGWKALKAHPFFGQHRPDLVEAVARGDVPPPWVPEPPPKRPDSEFVDFSIEFMLELDARESSDTFKPDLADATTPPGRPPRASSGRAETPAQQAVHTVDWAARVASGEQILATGVVWKRKGLFWRERVFVLTAAPRFVYFDCAKLPPEEKGDIKWTYERPVHCRKRSETHFDLVADHRDYHLAAYDDGGADTWIERVEGALDAQASRRLSASGLRPLSLSDAAPKPGTDDSACEGWLWKQGLSAASSYKKRYAVLRGVQLFYYRGAPTAKRKQAPAGVVRCVACRAVDASPRENSFAFDVDDEKGRVFHIFVDDDADRTRWLAALKDVIDARGD